MKKLILCIFIIFLTTEVFSEDQEVKKLSLFVYNVQNLFDVTHDNGKKDWTFLPNNIPTKKGECEKVTNKYYKKQCFQTDWNHKKLEIKLGQIKKVVTSVGKNIDIIALSEIENENVVKMLAKKLGYQNVVVSDSPDKRGIDLAVLFNTSKKIRKISQKEHIVQGDYFLKKPTRNILEVEFLIDEKHKTTIFVNHWPSQGNPSIARIAAAKLLQRRITEILKTTPSQNIIAVGDFNTISRDKPHPFKDILFKDHFLSDVREISAETSITGKLAGPEGTYYYSRGKVWNHLDRIMINKNLFDQKGMDYDVSSFKIHSPKLIKKEKSVSKKLIEVPHSYNFQSKSEKDAGFSDHYPIYSEFIL